MTVQAPFSDSSTYVAGDRRRMPRLDSVDRRETAREAQASAAPSADSEVFETSGRDQDVDQLRRAAQNRAASGPDAPFQKDGEVYRSYPNRKGYDENFLGTRLPMPRLDDSIKDRAVPLLADPTQNKLDYTHHSIIMDKERRAPMITAANLDGATWTDHERDGKWSLDARIDRKYQIGNEGYSNNDIDKGHMVRRSDPSWGENSFAGQDDTFSYTNAALQHGDLNQRNWLDLENHVQEAAVAAKQKVTVFTGPVFNESDPKFDNNGKMQPTKMPMQFFKVKVWNEEGKGLRGEAYVMDQKDIWNKPKTHDPDVHLTNFDQYRVTIKQLEDMTHLHFDGVTDNQPAPQPLVA